jgi:hypothetical protein
MKTAVKRSPRELVRPAVMHYIVMAIYQTTRALYRRCTGFACAVRSTFHRMARPSSCQATHRGVANIRLAYADRVLDQVPLAGHPRATVSPY